ncbi:hypothetical protein VPH35_074202 [Triticum aestivum]
MEFSSVSVRVTVADSFFALLPAFSARWRIHGSFISDSNSGSSFPIRFQYMLTRRSTRKARPLSRPTKPSNVDRAPWPSATATARDLLPSSTRRHRPRDDHPRTRNDRLPQEEAHPDGSAAPRTTRRRAASARAASSGIVVKARHRTTGKTVAIKFLGCTEDPADGTRELRREAG